MLFIDAYIHIVLISEIRSKYPALIIMILNSHFTSHRKIVEINDFLEIVEIMI